MRHINRLILFISLSFLLPAGVYAISASSQSSNVFKFQQKLANKGNAGAKFKLATMYESGTGIEQDSEQAKHWYNQASGAGVKAASDRLRYLSIKQRGYDKAKDATWLENLKKDVKMSKGDAMFLLAQLYREGLGVAKDLDKAMVILDQVSLLGAADVEDEMALIQQEMEANDKAKKSAMKKRKKEIARRQAKQKQHQAEQLANVMQQKVLVNEVPVAKQAQKAVELQKQEAAKAAAIQAGKIRRYEKAMMALKLEQQKIDEQQAWAAGSDSDVEDADDEI